MSLASQTKIAEAELIQLLKNGDEGGYGQLYDAYASALYGVIVKIVGEGEQANDILQEVFVKVWNNIQAYDNTKGALYTWLLNITRNTAIDYSRANTSAQKGQSAYERVTQYDPVVTNINKIGVKEIIEKLQPELKQVIDLIYFGGYTHVEVSQTLDLPLGTVKTRTRTAMRELKKLIR